MERLFFIMTQFFTSFACVYHADKFHISLLFALQVNINFKDNHGRHLFLRFVNKMRMLYPIWIFICSATVFNPFVNNLIVPLSQIFWNNYFNMTSFHLSFCISRDFFKRFTPLDNKKLFFYWLAHDKASPSIIIQIWLDFLSFIFTNQRR